MPIIIEEKETETKEIKKSINIIKEPVDIYTSVYITKAKKEAEEEFNERFKEEEKKINVPLEYKEIKKLSKEQKKKRRREKNRISANKAALKKKNYTKILEKYIIEMENKLKSIS